MVINIQPKTSSPSGQSYKHWIKTFWQQLCPIPRSQSPAINNDGSKDTNLNAPNKYNLYFLTFPREPQAPQERNITVPAGTALFIPVMSVIVSECEKPGATETQLVQISNKDQSSIAPNSIKVVLDGQELNNVNSWRFNANEVGTFDVSFPSPTSDAIFNIASSGPCSTVAAGIYLITEPLDTGNHTIKWKGELHCSPPSECIDIDYMEDITYNVTVSS
jgi:hypothetical protein